MYLTQPARFGCRGAAYPQSVIFALGSPGVAQRYRLGGLGDKVLGLFVNYTIAIGQHTTIDPTGRVPTLSSPGERRGVEHIAGLAL